MAEKKDPAIRPATQKETEKAWELHREIYGDQSEKLSKGKSKKA